MQDVVQDIVLDTRRIKLPEAERIENRRKRAEYYFNAIKDGKSYEDVAKEVGHTIAHVRLERNWYIENYLPIGIRAELRMTKSERNRIEAQERKAERTKARLERAKNVIDELMGGKTIIQVADELGIQPQSVYPIIRTYEKYDPEYVKQYHEVMRTHKFGHFRKQAQ